MDILPVLRIPLMYFKCWTFGSVYYMYTVRMVGPLFRGILSLTDVFVSKFCTCVRFQWWDTCAVELVVRDSKGPSIITKNGRLFNISIIRKTPVPESHWTQRM